MDNRETLILQGIKITEQHDNGKVTVKDIPPLFCNHQKQIQFVNCKDEIVVCKLTDEDVESYEQRERAQIGIYQEII